MNKAIGLILATGFFTQCLIFSYFSWVQNEQNRLIRELGSRLEKQEFGATEALPSVELSRAQKQTVTLKDSQQLSSKQIQSLVRYELAQFQNELRTTLSDVYISDNSTTAVPLNEIDSVAVQSANDNMDELYINALARGQWLDQDRTQLQENLHMVTEEQRNQVLDKLIIAINSGEIITDGRPLF